MKIVRSSKCNLKFTNQGKIEKLKIILEEYSKAVNYYIDLLKDWELKEGQFIETSIINSFQHEWMTHRLKKNACREAVGMLCSYQEKIRNGDKKAQLPHHYGKSMTLTSTCVNISFTDKTDFDLWLHIYSIGNGYIFDIPLKKHKHFNKWLEKGKINNTVTIYKDKIQFSFDIKIEKKKEVKKIVGLDTGIKALVSLSDGKQLGTDIEEYITKVKRRKQGSKGQKKARRALKQRMDEIVKEVTDNYDLIVIENLKNITKNTKKRNKNKKYTDRRFLSKNMRRSIGSWNVRYFQKRLMMACENKKVSYRQVKPYNTSITCPSCGLVDWRNRSGTKYSCSRCGYTANADCNAALNILERFITGVYGACYKPLFNKLDLVQNLKYTN